MFSRLVGGQQTEKASQDQVSDKAAAGVTALAKLVRTVGADSGFQAVAQASRDLAAQVDCITHTEQTIKQLSKKLDSLYASYSAALEGLQSVLPLQYTTEEICTQLEQQQEGTQMNVIEHSKT